jgi:hypothetical protein
MWAHRPMIRHHPWVAPLRRTRAWRGLVELAGGPRRRQRILSERPWAADYHPGLTVRRTMLSAAEIEMLHWLGAWYFRGRGVIVDAGCFLGGSTAALAAGVAANQRVSRKPRRWIHSYDMFVIDWYAKREFFADSPLQIGDSFYEEWRANVAPWEHLLNVHRGDVCAHGWSGERVEILFLDVMKTVAVQTAVTERWFPRLIGGRSVLIQQDYVHEWQPWILVSMELLHEYFLPLDYFDYGSAVYLCLRTPTREAVAAADVARLSLATQLAILERAATRVPARYVPVIGNARAKLLIDFGRYDEAKDAVAEVWRRWPDDARARSVGDGLLAHADRAADGVTASA